MYASASSADAFWSGARAAATACCAALRSLSSRCASFLARSWAGDAALLAPAPPIASTAITADWNAAAAVGTPVLAMRCMLVSADCSCCDSGAVAPGHCRCFFCCC